MKKIAFMINMHSGTARDKYKQIKDELKEYDVVEIHKIPEFKKAYKKIIKSKPDLIVLAGGDGTIIKGIETFVELGHKGPFAILPFGTANYLARNLNIPLTPKEALDVALKSKKITNVPLATANGELFSLMVTMGLSRSISDNVSDKLKRKFGQMAYVFELLKQSKEHEPFTYEIISDELRKNKKGMTHEILVYNSDLNPQLKLVPDHKIDKPTVKVVISDSGKSMIRLFLSFILHALTWGKYTGMLKVYELKQLKILTHPNQKASLDGEVSGEGPHEIIANATKAKIVTP